MYFFQTRKFKIGLVITAALAVVLVVLFSNQIGNLLKFFGSKAGVGEEVTFDTWTEGAHTNTETGNDGKDYLIIQLPPLPSQ